MNSNHSSTTPPAATLSPQTTAITVGSQPTIINVPIPGRNALPQNPDDSSENGAARASSNVVVPVIGGVGPDFTFDGLKAIMKASSLPLRSQILAADFMAVNPAHFPQFSADPNQLGAQSQDLLTLRMGGTTISIHRDIIQKADMFMRAFNTDMSEGKTGIMDLEGDYLVWMVVVLAMYGAHSLPLSLIRHRTAQTIIEAMVQAEYILAARDVKTNICKMLANHFSLFKDWKNIKYELFTIHDHENRAIEINEAWKAYKALPSNVMTPFSELGFGLLIQHHCPGHIYGLVEYLFDDGLVRLVAHAAKSRASGMYVEAPAWALITPEA